MYGAQIFIRLSQERRKEQETGHESAQKGNGARLGEAVTGER